MKSIKKNIFLILLTVGVLALISYPAVATYGQILYETDFSSDPGWTTDQPSNFYWEPATQTYLIHQINQPESYEPNRYSYIEVPYHGGPFCLEWDLEMLRSDWSAGVNFGLFDSNLRYWPPIDGSAGLCVEYVNPDSGRGFTVFAYQDTTGTFSNDWTRFELNVWYHNIFEYNPGSATATWTVYILGESTPFMQNTLTDVPPITNEIIYLGATRYALGTGGVNPNAVGEARIDNLTLSAIPEPGALLLLAPGLLGIAGVLRGRKRKN